ENPPAHQHGLGEGRAVGFLEVDHGEQLLKELASIFHLAGNRQLVHLGVNVDEFAGGHGAGGAARKLVQQVAARVARKYSGHDARARVLLKAVSDGVNLFLDVPELREFSRQPDHKLG